ncbi:STAS domain-containing protein [Streptomyces sp. NPDC005951]|uniref:STAS domain-containing protein n=1 Tax=Streptomyces sp. NPDC005951 TaxID=3154573 RepID=UPI0033D59CA9
MYQGHGDEPGLQILHTVYPTAYLLSLRGSTDPTTALRVAEAFDRAAHWSLPLIVDLSGLGFGDEELLGYLMTAHQTTGLTLVGPLSDSFQRRLHTTGLTALFTIHPTLDAALNH